MMCRVARPLKAWCFALLLAARCADAVSVKKGAIKLDNYTFDKMIAVQGLNLLVKVDKLYGYTNAIVFEHLCHLVHKVPDFLLAELPVALSRDSEIQMQGSGENEDIAERYGFSEKTFPSFLFFPAADTTRKPRLYSDGFPDVDAKQPTSWDETEDGPWERPLITDLTTENMVTWMKTFGIRLPSVGTITEFDDIVEKFMRTSKIDERKAFLDQLVEMAAGEHKADDKTAVYIKIAQKVLASGDSYVDKELERIEKVIASGNLKPPKKKELVIKQKVIEIFADHKRT